MPTALHVKDGDKTQFSRVASLNWSKHCVPPSVDNFNMTTSALLAIQLRTSVGRQIHCSACVVGVQSAHAFEDYAITNTAMEVRSSVSLMWRGML